MGAVRRRVPVMVPIVHVVTGAAIAAVIPVRVENLHAGAHRVAHVPTIAPKLGVHVRALRHVVVGRVAHALLIAL